MNWLQYNTEHYILFYHSGSIAEKDILQIAEWQECCYQRLSRELDMALNQPTRMYLCDSANEIAHITGCPPSNGMTFDYDLIYAVYNDKIHCLGPHEDAHIFSYQIALPTSFFLREGFAMYFDESYHGKRNIEITNNWLNSNKSFSVTSLMDNKVFHSLPEEITYPLAGAFTEWIVQQYGISKYLEIYRNEGDFNAILSVPPSEVDILFRSVIDDNLHGVLE